MSAPSGNASSVLYRILHMRNKKILYVAQEITPYLKPSLMGNVCQVLPGKVQEQGYEVRAFMPKYGCINERRNQLHEVIRLSGANIVIDDNDHPLVLKVATLQSSRMQVYFIDNDDYFQSRNMKDLEIRETPDDNDERMMFFTRGVVDTVKKLRWEPSVISCAGWISSLTPLLVKKQYADDPTVGPAKVVFKLFNDSFDGQLDSRFEEKMKMDNFTDSDLEPLKIGTPADWIALNKLAMRYADGIMLMDAEVPAELQDYARSLGVPFMDATAEELDGAAIVEFYQNL